jgi:hypothetical protein
VECGVRKQSPQSPAIDRFQDAVSNIVILMSHAAGIDEPSPAMRHHEDFSFWTPGNL